MPYKSIAAAKDANFPTSAEGIDLTLAQINKLAEIYDSIKKAGNTKNPFAVAWTTWKKLYKKVNDKWVTATAASIRFGTEKFVASFSDANNELPAHAIVIEGRLIHINTKNLANWGVVDSATEQIMAGIPGVPIRACKSLDPHQCDYEFDNKSHIGYGVKAWIDDGWIWASAAITDQEASSLISNGTWTPFGKGNWSVAGLPTEGDHFESTGMLSGYQPTGISLVFAPSTPAFVGSGFDMVAAAITNHRGDNMTEENEAGGGGTDPVMYSQEDLDAKVAEALETQKTQEAHDTAAELAKQQAVHDTKVSELSPEQKADFDNTLAQMTPTADVEMMIAAAAAKMKEDTLESIEKEKLAKEYGDLLVGSVVLGAPFKSFGQIDPAKLDAKLAAVRTMPVAAINAMIEEAKMQVAAASPAQSAFDESYVAGNPPGTNGDIELLADLNELSGRFG